MLVVALAVRTGAAMPMLARVLLLLAPQLQPAGEAVSYSGIGLKGSNQSHLRNKILIYQVYDFSLQSSQCILHSPMAFDQISLIIRKSITEL